jgi:hypothetical protein
MSWQSIHLGLTKQISYSDMNELIIVFSFFRTQCNDVLVMITWVEMSINDIGHNHGKGIERDYLMVQGLHRTTLDFYNIYCITIIVYCYVFIIKIISHWKNTNIWKYIGLYMNVFLSNESKWMY